VTKAKQKPKRKPEEDLLSQIRALIAANRDITNGEVAKKLGITVRAVRDILDNA
jgi:predicted ArsR family transcriptional regulator